MRQALSLERMLRVRSALPSSSGRGSDVGGTGENASVLEMLEVSSALRNSRPRRLAEKVDWCRARARDCR